MHAHGVGQSRLQAAFDNCTFRIECGGNSFQSNIHLTHLHTVCARLLPNWSSTPKWDPQAHANAPLMQTGNDTHFGNTLQTAHPSHHWLNRVDPPLSGHTGQARSRQADARLRHQTRIVGGPGDLTARPEHGQLPRTWSQQVVIHRRRFTAGTDPAGTAVDTHCVTEVVKNEK